MVHAVVAPKAYCVRSRVSALVVGVKPGSDSSSISFARTVPLRNGGLDCV